MVAGSSTLRGETARARSNARAASSTWPSASAARPSTTAGAARPGRARSASSATLRAASGMVGSSAWARAIRSQ